MIGVLSSAAGSADARSAYRDEKNRPAGQSVACGLAEEIEQSADLLADLQGMTHRLFAVDVVAIAPADPVPVDVAGVDEVTDDPLCGPLRDSDRLRNVAHPDVRVTSKAEKHLAVVRQERP